jgi:serine/threonine protein kinase
VAIERDSRLGKYIIRQRLAGGGMGVVYRARDAQLGREVALKTILADKAADKDFLLRFKREALSIAQIDHPNIVSLIDFVEGDPSKGEIAFMVMEYLKGKDLGRLIKETGPFEVTRAVDRILEVCAAVGTCHRRGFLHRDLKPTNIFITEYDHIETAKVLDFGVAKMWAENEEPVAGAESEELTKKGMVFGTPEYIAPELLKNKPATPKVDQYAIGVVLFAALTGRKPFIADPKADVPDLDLWQAVAKGHHPKPRELRKDIPRGLEDAIERAMSPNPDDRFRDVHELGAHLLPWASPAARHRWTAHFTSAPPVAMSPQLSIAIAISPHTGDSTIPAPFPPTFSTVADRPDPWRTRPVGTDELALAGESSAVAARRPPRGEELPSTSLPIVVEEAASKSAVAPSVSTLSTPPRSSFAAFIRRPITLILAGGIALLAAIVVAAALHRAEPTAHPDVAAPPALLNHPEPAARPSQALPAAPLAPGTAPPATTPTPAVAPPSERSETPPPREPKRPHHTRQKPQAVDQKGFPIPSE